LPLRSEGIDAIRQRLLVEITSIEQATARVTSSRANVEAQAKALADERKQLDSDMTSWSKDVAAATATAAAFDDRFRAATTELAGLETSIVRLGKELSTTWAVLLTETIDAAAR
jgi:septal ring factor EnvC (AmiA/AmiB activator)